MSWNDDERWNDDELNNRITTNGFVVEPFDIDNGPTDPTAGIGEDISLLGRIDQYEILKELGTGGFGSVYLARDTVSRTFVAVKGLPALVKNNAEEMERIRDNFALVSRLHHPNIAAALVLHPANSVSYFDSAVAEKLNVKSGNTLMVMEYAPGVTLTKWRRQFPGCKVPIDKAIEITRQIADAMDYAHQRKIIHRDIKPSNVMVETYEDGTFTARVLDFGLAAEVRSSMNRVSQEKENMAGTREYMSPEQWKGRDLGFATDQYALAVLFYELIVGKVPFLSAFECGDPIVAMVAATTQPLEFPEELPGAVCAALAKALAKKQKDRFATCGDFVRAISRQESGIELEDSAEKHLRPSSPEGGLRSNEDFGLVRDSVSRNLGLEGKNHPEDQVVRDWYDRLSLKMKVLWQLRTCASALIYIVGWIHMIVGLVWVFGAKLKFDIPVAYRVVSFPIGALLFMVAATIGSKEPKGIVKSVVLWLRDLLRGYVRIDIVTLISNLFRVLGGVYLMLFGLVVPGVIVYALIFAGDYELLVRFVSLSGLGLGAYVLGSRLLMRRKIGATRGSFVKWLIIIGMSLLLMLFQQGRKDSNLRQKRDDAGSAGGNVSHVMEKQRCQLGCKMPTKSQGPALRDVLVGIGRAERDGDNAVLVDVWKKFGGTTGLLLEQCLDTGNDVYRVCDCYNCAMAKANLEMGGGVECREYVQRWYEKAIEAGCEIALVRLGLLYQFGRLGQIDDAKARALFERAARSREQHICALAMNILANYSSTTADDSSNDRPVAVDDSDTRRDEVEAFRRYRKSAKQGNAVAQYNLGEMYADGRGVEKDDVEAVRWYRMAAEQGNADAQKNLGVMYENGRGVESNEVEAVRWYRKAAEQGHVKAQACLGWCYYKGKGVKQDYVKAVEWHRKAAEREYAVAQFCLGYCYDRGKGVKQDYAKAVEWYRKAADRGYAEAQLFLALRYYQGKGVKQDYAMAAEWCRKAAEQGLAAAQWQLGAFYESGSGVEQDPVKAVEWYRRAAKLGFARAQQDLRERNLTWE